MSDVPTQNLLPGISELSGLLERHPGGHNWPDMEIVFDAGQTEVEDNEIYLISVPRRSDNREVKRLRHYPGDQFMLRPAVSSVHGFRKVNVLGHDLPCTSIEFSDNIYKRNVVVHGRVVGLWAGTPQE